MRAFPIVVLSLFVFGLLAGCTSPDGPTTTTTEPVIITDPRDVSYLKNGTTGSHVHDYWQGRSVVTVLDYESGQFAASCGSCDDGMQVLVARPEEGVIVPQGTAWLNVTVSWTEGGDGTNDFGAVRLLVRNAKAHELADAGLVENGVLRVLNTTNEEDDPPHYVLSLWRFGVEVLPKAGEEVSFSGTFHVRVDAVRGLPLVAYPPHPDRWGGLTELPLAGETHTTDLEYQEELQGGTSTTCYGGCLGRILPSDGAVVPVEASEVIVTLRFEPGSIPTGVGLRYHGADTWRMSAVAGVASTPPGTVTFRIPITGAMADSPYAPQSLWEFELFLDQPTQVRAWSGTYEFSASSVRAAS